jgi:hypothetical protein
MTVQNFFISPVVLKLNLYPKHNQLANTSHISKTDHWTLVLLETTSSASSPVSRGRLLEHDVLVATLTSALFSSIRSSSIRSSSTLCRPNSVFLISCATARAKGGGTEFPTYRRLSHCKALKWSALTCLICSLTEPRNL